MRKYCVPGDIQKAFIRIRVHEQDRDAKPILRFDNLIELNIGRFFGATSSSYILGATLQKPRKQGHQKEFPATAKSLLEDTYVDDIQGGGTEIDAVKQNLLKYFRKRVYFTQLVQ